MAGVLGRLWEWLGREIPPEDMPNSTCPICGVGVEIAPTRYFSRFVGWVRFPATREERIAACPEHGYGRGPASGEAGP